MSPDAVTALHNDHWSLFLDVDGILLDIAETPQRVHISETLKQLLVALTVQLDGAVALLSWRSLDDVDRLFSPLRFCAACVRGHEYRESSGCVTRTGAFECNAASAMSLFMRHRPFAHRIPVLIGQHPTYEATFATVNQLGGISINVGDVQCSAACHRLAGVDDVIEWLENVVGKPISCG